MKPYGLMSDQHAFDWSQFAGTDSVGVNIRLRHILNEMVRCADAITAAGGDTIVFAGDLFHTRGAIAPSVFNPVHATIKLILERGIRILAIPGNHDLASKETTELGNAMQSLGGLPGFTVITEPMDVKAGDIGTGQSLFMVPWISTTDALKKRLEDAASSAAGYVGQFDLIIHAGIDGVLSGLPGNDLSPAWLAGLGFKRVFGGHFHHHCVFEDGKVVSIGATGHQTFGDIGTKAGFLIVHEDRIQHFASHCPNFVEVTGATDVEEMVFIADGNFVRVRGMKLTDREVNETRAALLGMGAKGVSFQVERVTEVARPTGTAKPGVSLDDSLTAFVAGKSFVRPDVVQKRALEILSEVRATASE